MQTFLPYADFDTTAEVLDWRRLGKQRVEAKQILMALTENKGWVNHPCTKMWKGYEIALARYGEAICKKWISKGYKDTLLPYFQAFIGECVYPAWLGNEAFHAAHRSNLLRKAPYYYKQFNWTEPNDLEYIWGNA